MGRGVARLPLARSQGDDLGDPASPAREAVDGCRTQIELDDQVDSGGQLAGGELVGDVRPGFHRARHELANRGDGVGSVRRGDRAGARLHRLDHRPDLLAANLANRIVESMDNVG